MTDTTEFSAASNKADNGLVTQTSRILANFQRFTSQPSFQRSFPAIIAVIAVAVGPLAYAILQQPERTTLYASLPDSEKSKVVDALKNQGVDVSLDPTTGEVLTLFQSFLFEQNPQCSNIHQLIYQSNMSILILKEHLCERLVHHYSNY